VGRSVARAARREVARRAKTEAARRARRRRRLRLASWWGAALSAVALIAVVVAVNSGSGPGPLLTADDPVLGDAAAPVTIVWYGDYKCPFCARFTIQTEPRLRAEFVETGKVRLVYRDFPNIDAESAPAAEAARCAGAQGKFWEYHDALYRFIWDNFYGRGINAEGVQAYEGRYEQLARQVGLDVDTFRACRDAGTYRDVVAASRDAGVSQGVRGTPTFFINGQRLVGAQPYDVFRRLVEAELEGAS